MKNSIIITGDFKEKYLARTILSCLKQTLKPDEIILIYNSLANENLLKQKFKKKIKFIKTKEKIKNPVQDQLNKIKTALKYCNGKIIFLCDGDDIFIKNKIKIINCYLNNQNEIFLHNFRIKKNKKIYSIPNKTYKKNYFYKKFFNCWPDKISTSSIVISKKRLIYFFKFHKILRFKFLAVDALLCIFYQKNIRLINNILTIKNENDYNRVDLYYTNYFKNYVSRRVEQHEYYTLIHKEKKKLEYLVLRFINYFI